MAQLRPARSVLVALVVIAAATQTTHGQGIDATGRPVAEIRLEGLDQVEPQLVLNSIRTTRGQPYDPAVVSADVERLTHLSKFANVQVRIEPQADGSLVVVYVLTEQRLITDVQIVGNKQHLPDQKLLGAARVSTGDPADPYLIDRARKQIVATYREAGYFDTSVSIDQRLLEDTGILLFRVVEGPRLRVRTIHFEGNRAFTAKQLASKVSVRTYIPLLRKGEFSRQRTDADAATLRQFYQDRGFLDAEVVREFQASPDGRDAAVQFTISEGERYTVARIVVKGNAVFSTAQVQEAISLRVGDVFSVNRQKTSTEELTNLYGELGFIEAKVAINPIFLEDPPHTVEVLIRIEEGQPYWVGTISVKGNSVTQDRVIKRQVRDLWPGRRFVGSGIKRTEKRLTESALFEEGRVAVLGSPQDEYRDVLIEVKEKNTGSIGLGAGISSDAGVIGAFDITQRNFDIADAPESFGELITGKAFRGAGQYMRIALQPGADTSRFSITLREPYLFDSSLFLDTSAFFFQRQRDDYDEQRVGGTVGLGQRFGDVWKASIETRVERIDIGDIDDDAPVDVFDVEGKSNITSLGLAVRRSTVDNIIFPTRGNRLVLGLGRAGALGGDYDFTRVTTEFRQFWTVEEDFFGRRTVLSARVQTGYILEEDEAPVFERFYAGGHRTIRGFDYRGVGPRGIRADTGKRGNDPVGGDWLFLLGVEYNIPIYQEIVRAVLFMDTGTVEDDIGFTDYRASVGTGIRIRIPFLGQAPFALDFAYPFAREDDDEERLVSFDLAIPF